MEVIKHGRVYDLQNFGKEIECRCGAHLKIVLDDLESVKIPTSDMKGERYTETYIGVTCPECEQIVRLEDLPNEVVEYVHKPKERIKEKSRFPTYHEMLDYLCRELQIPGSPDFHEAVKWLKTRGTK